MNEKIDIIVESNSLNSNVKTGKIIKKTSDSLFDLTKPVKPELLEYTGVTIVVVWIALVIWINQIGKKKSLEGK